MLSTSVQSGIDLIHSERLPDPAVIAPQTPSDELFAGQLNDVFVDVEQAVVEEQPVDGAKPDQAKPDAEEWLLAMLDQQQLQLQARDKNTSVPVDVSVKKASQLPLDIVNQPATLPVEKPALPNLSSREVTQIINLRDAPIQLPVIAQVSGVSPVADEARVPDGTGVNASSAAPVSTASMANTSAHIASVISLTETDVAQPVAVTTLNAVSGEAVQRSTQSQLNLHAPEAKWGEQLLHALRDNVQVQIQQRIQHATIRLDPPELGALEIYLSHESGRLTVNITASQADVARLIQHTSDRLRHELAGPQFTQVNVQTSAEGQSGQQQSRDRQRFMADEIILANEQSLVDSNRQAHRSGDVLVTV